MRKFPQLPEPYRLDKHVILKEQKAAAILNPAVQLSFFDTTNKIQVTGPRGTATINPNESADFLTSLIAVNAILTGDEVSILFVQEKLLTDETSRTAAYLCCIADDCDQIMQFYAKIEACSIAVVGCGGIGSLSAQILAGGGIKSIVLADHDQIEKSNFNRQYFWTLKDIGRSKVEVLKENLHERYPELNISVHKEKITDNNLETIIASVDAVLFTADEPIGLLRKARIFSEKHNKKFIGAGYFMSEAILSLSSQERMTDERDILPLPQKIAPSFGPTNVEIAGAASSYLLLLMGD
ncbi:hypothetical protein AQ505_05995 [Pedobacter sp. PACM 27299]|uniref:ThiF family adenylyltransferase n=1 Tax=Pedobacter sp. PACM 27299 TaxID=1727164 RepID=UPI00070621B8|nr:ThiF family adenylyltransferase [Pedobacter sp. PACM 27299]ALL05086.1 hypothetical protein AQ505_05995 [Pedobacter sp. PACM 27299]